MDSKSIGLCPQGFESPRCRFTAERVSPLAEAPADVRGRPSDQAALPVGSSRARGVVVSHPLSMREALGSIPSVSIFLAFSKVECMARTRRPRPQASASEAATLKITSGRVEEWIVHHIMRTRSAVGVAPTNRHGDFFELNGAMDLWCRVHTNAFSLPVHQAGAAWH